MKFKNVVIQSLAAIEPPIRVTSKEIEKKLAALKAKHGTTPNIIHIMWDDTAVGEIGVPHNQANRGFKTPNINKFSAEGQYYSRM